MHAELLGCFEVACSTSLHAAHLAAAARVAASSTLANSAELQKVKNSSHPSTQLTTIRPVAAAGFEVKKQTGVPLYLRGPVRGSRCTYTAPRCGANCVSASPVSLEVRRHLRCCPLQTAAGRDFELFRMQGAGRAAAAWAAACRGRAANPKNGFLRRPLPRTLQRLRTQGGLEPGPGKPTTSQ